jgi:hypothetical protein
VKTGQFANSAAPQTLVFDSLIPGRYFRLVALSEISGNPWASAAEFSLTGCVDWPTGINPKLYQDKLTAFPVPASGHVEVTLPYGKRFDYQVVSSAGRIVRQGSIESPDGPSVFSLVSCAPGFYLIYLTDEQGIKYRVKVVKK